MGRIGRCYGRNARLARVWFVRPAARVSPTANPVGGNKEVPNTMYVPATLAQPPGGPALRSRYRASTTPPLQTPAHTSLSVTRTELNVLEGHTTSVTGKLITDAHSLEGGEAVPAEQSVDHAAALPGREVLLQALGSHGWRTLAHTRTGSEGRFRLRYMPLQTASEQVRLRFAGDAEDLERTPAAGPPRRLSPSRGLVVWRRRRAGLRRRADERDDGVANRLSMRHGGDAALWRRSVRVA